MEHYREKHPTSTSGLHILMEACIHTHMYTQCTYIHTQTHKRDLRLSQPPQMSKIREFVLFPLNSAHTSQV